MTPRLRRCARLNATSVVLGVWAVLVILFGRTDALVVGMLVTIAIALAVQTRELVRLYRRHHL